MSQDSAHTPSIENAGGNKRCRGLGHVMSSVVLGCIVLASFFGLARLPLRPPERYSHALAGLAIFLCGGAIKWLGL